MRVLFLFLAFFALTAQRDPILVPEVSQHEIQLRQGFTGTELLLYGAILDPDGSRAGEDYNIVVVLKGPTQSIKLREKNKVFGIWINTESADFRSAPSFYALSSSRPVPEIVDERTAAIYELGLDWLQLSPIGAIDPDEQARFSSGLVDLRRGSGLYKEDPRGVTISEQVLYQARISLPSSVQAGTYTAETFAVYDGQVIASATAQVNIRKVGFERFVADFAQDLSFFYGLIVVIVSITMGWIAGRFFALT